jgi:hypothetical protein
MGDPPGDVPSSALSRLIGRIAPGTRRSPEPAPEAAATALLPPDPIDELFLARRYAEVIDLMLRLMDEGPIDQPRYASRFGRACMEAGRPDLLLERAQCFTRRVQQHRGVRTQQILALIILDRIPEARDLIRQCLVVGQYDLSMLLRLIGEYRRLDDAELVLDLIRIVYRNWTHELTWRMRGIYLPNIALNLGHLDSITRESAPRPTSRLGADDYFLMCNVAIRQRDGVGALDHFNDALDSHGLSPVTLRDAGRPLSAGNIEARPGLDYRAGPMVSIVMPSYNAEAKIIPALRSLSAQSYRNIEVIVVDDCSTDDTAGLVARYAREVDGRVRLVAMPRNGGPYVARNRALADARGAYFTCNDADDWAHPDKLSILVEAIEGEGTPVAVQSRLVRLSAELGLKPRREGYVHADLSSTLFRRELVVDRIGFYEPARFGADSEYLARLQIAFGDTAITPVPKPLLVSDWADNTLTAASSTGITDGGLFSPRRAAYRETYRARHARGEGLFIGRADAGLDP